MRKQAERFGAGYLAETVVGVDLSKRPFAVHTEVNTYLGRTLIVAPAPRPGSWAWNRRGN